MTRKNTLMIAVLINLGLLAILFATAVNFKEKQTLTVLDKSESIVPAGSSSTEQYTDSTPMSLNNTAMPHSSNYANPVHMAPAAIPHAIQDEVDQALHQYTPPAVLVPLQPAAPAIVAFNSSSVVDEQTEKNAEETKKAFSTNTTEIKIRSGDTLGKIARQHGVSVEAIKQANQLKSDQLNIGQVLRIPAANSESRSNKNVMAVVAETNASSAEYYTVRAGDNPWIIANKHKIKLDDLLRLNSLDKEKARHLKPGDKLRIR